MVSVKVLKITSALLLDYLFRPTIHQASRVASLIAKAMHDDPLHIHLVPSEEQRKKILPILFRLIAKFGIYQGRLFSTSEDLEGVAIWLTPKDKMFSGFLDLLSEGASLFAKAGIKIMARMIRYSHYARKLHKRHGSFAHWYLALLAVDPLHQRQKYASSLVRPVLAFLDIEKLPCYLETHSAKNAAIYQHYGFRIVEVGKIPGSSITQWSMVRG